MLKRKARILLSFAKQLLGGCKYLCYGKIPSLPDTNDKGWRDGGIKLMSVCCHGPYLTIKVMSTESEMNQI